MLQKDVKLISVDDHVVEPRDVWDGRMASKHRDAAPHVVELNDMDEAWVWEGRTYPIGLMGSPKTRVFRDQAGTGEDFRARSYRDMVPACFDVGERIKAMDTDGVGAALNFPTFPRFAGTLFLEGKDKELTSACVQAYNDWMLEEWVGGAPDRFIPMTVVQLWDPGLAAAEVRRCAANGSKSITMCENPAPLGLPSFWTDFWDPLWDAVQETNLVVSMHIGTSGGLTQPSADSTEAVSISLCGLNSMSACAELTFSGTLQKFPGLRIALSEGGAGWAPYLIERMDYTWERTRVGVDRAVPPSELFKRHFWTCFIWDETAIHVRDLIGVEKLMWECDFPHNDCNWPDSRTMLEKAMQDVPDDVCRRIAETNARELYDFRL